MEFHKSKNTTVFCRQFLTPSVTVPAVLQGNIIGLDIRETKLPTVPYNTADTVNFSILLFFSYFYETRKKFFRIVFYHIMRLKVWT